jgi:cellobiose-specific phosphotransferase system component IIC
MKQEEVSPKINNQRKAHGNSNILAVMELQQYIATIILLNMSKQLRTAWLDRNIQINIMEPVPSNVGNWKKSVLRPN